MPRDATEDDRSATSWRTTTSGCDGGCRIGFDGSATATGSSDAVRLADTTPSRASILVPAHRCRAHRRRDCGDLAAVGSGLPHSARYISRRRDEAPRTHRLPRARAPAASDALTDANPEARVPDAAS